MHSLERWIPHIIDHICILNSSYLFSHEPQYKKKAISRSLHSQDSTTKVENVYQNL